MHSLKPFETIAIAGAGIMGSSIAQIFARYGFDVLLYDIEEDFLKRSRQAIELNQQTLVDTGQLSKEASASLKERIRHTLDIECFREAEVVIEAIVEELGAKSELWRKISALAPAEALLTTNTSGLSISAIAEAVVNPGRFCGFHWVNPPHIVPLVEVISGQKTLPQTAQAVYDLALYIGKQPVLVHKDPPGFVLNRIQFAVLREAMHIVASGMASVEDVDTVLREGLGLRYACLGPFEVADLGGLDTFSRIASYLFPDLSDAKEVPAMLQELVDEGARGVKAGRGFYDYSQGRGDQVIAGRDENLFRIAQAGIRRV